MTGPAATPLVGVGERLLHIGPHKTGSTTLQAAFHQNRPLLAGQGVHYAGRNAQPMAAAMAAASGNVLPTAQPGAVDPWGRLVEEVREADADRVVVSSEFFCEADRQRAEAILDGLGGAERVQVVVTLRPLSRIVASQWQQYMQNRMTASYDAWLRAVLADPPDTSVTPSFWRRHRHDEVVARWAEAAGADRVTVVVVDESDRLMLVRAFEEMLALSSGTLRPRNVAANRSLTYPEVEMMRSFNAVWRQRGWSEADYTRLVRFGAVRHLQERTPGADEPRVLTPPWAADRIVEVEHAIVAGLEATGVRVVGDLGLLTSPVEDAAVGVNDPVTVVPAEIAARFAAGLVRHADEVPARAAADTRSPGPFEAALRLWHEHDAVVQRGRRLRRRRERGSAVEGSSAEIVRALAGRARRRLRRD